MQCLSAFLLFFFCYKKEQLLKALVTCKKIHAKDFAVVSKERGALEVILPN